MSNKNNEILLVSNNDIPGYKITKVLGLVRGNTVRARHVGKDIMALLRNLVGGEIHEYTKLMAESREHSIDRMLNEAKQLGANAVVSSFFTTSMISSSAAEILVFGTAVIIEKE